MKFKNAFACFGLVLSFHFTFAQTTKINWWNPQTATFPVLEGQAWPKEVKNPYDRLPARAEKQVREQVWGLSNQSAGLMLRFRANSAEISVRYVVNGKHALPHMPATGVSGVDLYAISSDGDWRWCAGKYTFGDTITYTFRGLEPNDSYHQRGREYRLYLPLYNSVKWLEVGAPEGTAFTPLATRPDKPIVIYGTSIAHGACASRPGMAWTAILGRKLDHPLINLGFSGNGRLEEEVVSIVSEIDAKIFVLDCLPNLTIRPDSKLGITIEDVKNRILATTRALRKKHPNTPIVLASHAGYTDEDMNPQSKHFYSEVNETLKEAFAQLKSEGVRQIFIIPKADFGQDIETMVDGTHPNDLGMMRYAEGYEKHLRQILHEYKGIASTTRPVIQMRELNNYDWEARHQEILDLNRKNPPATVIIGNSITHFWGGLPKGPRATGADSWDDTFGKNTRNMGYGWDRIENVLWRINHGELDGYAAKQVLVNIGTNNLHLNSDEEIVEGWRMLIDAIKFHQPDAQIIMLGIYPRRQQEGRVSVINEKLAQLTGEMNVNYLDPGKVFLQKDGKIDETLFSDGLHPNAKGYKLLGDSIKPLVK
ncbi:SGNH/GDSL hydrolase family protein [Dyadobacter fanqingshengii]|uniref:SGNH/GDSL hydrolase family protein n=1 Tax=Dyadobacter fanqingshengii TaxID=2906443 RepID=A0A9X1PFB7_9BACT|nr:SGNH/GDSL hydrolase family protein [Dyadobacter fanqingshengii]MCF0042838.1 SGNH/GDSL hydrolase family protein [Dyadobacter fanqingshengii]USJ35944.1 SGNH/GDSL hydrolase family protein [Dyadobacter fanqingshengii]